MQLSSSNGRNMEGSSQLAANLDNRINDHHMFHHRTPSAIIHAIWLIPYLTSHCDMGTRCKWFLR